MIELLVICQKQMTMIPTLWCSNFKLAENEKKTPNIKCTGRRKAEKQKLVLKFANPLKKMKLK